MNKKERRKERRAHERKMAIEYPSFNIEDCKAFTSYFKALDFFEKFKIIENHPCYRFDKIDSIAQWIRSEIF